MNGKSVVAGAALVVLAGCASEAPHYYSLQSASLAAPTAAAAQVDAAYAISVQPVMVPDQVARPQILVQMAEGSEVVPLSTALWAGPLEAQWRSALAANLTRRLNVMDLGTARVGDALPVWQIFVDVQQFDSYYGRMAQQQIVWRLVPPATLKSAKPRVCTAQASVPVDVGMSALVEGHRQAVAGLAEAIAATLPAPGKGAGAGGSGALAAGSSAAPGAASLPAGVVFRGCTA